MLQRMSAESPHHTAYIPKTADQRRYQFLYSGRVQGVGFRYTVKNIAMRFDVSGYVRNLPDGRVELVIEGPPQEVEEMRQAVAEKMSGYIRQIETSTLPATGEFSHFHIRH